MQTQGSLREANLASLLQTMQSERATGTLTLEGGAGTCSLYFLFGHLFHASDASRQGEDVVVDALNWGDGSFHFDPRAKLPAEETIKSSPADLIAEAATRAPMPVAEAPAAEAPATAGAPAEPAAAETSSWAPAETPSYSTAWPPAASDPDNAPSPDDAAYATEPQQESSWSQTPAAQESTWGQPEETAAPDYSSAWNTPTETPVETPSETPSETPAETPAQETSWGTPAAEAEAPEARSSTWNTTAPASEAEAQPEPQTEAEPEPMHSSAATGADPQLHEVAVPQQDTQQWVSAPSAPAAPLAVMYPLPSGKITYEGLKSAFVDFPKLLRTLRADSHTGYVHLQSDGFSGTLVFQAGQLIEALADANGQVAQGDSAFQQFRQQMDAGSGHLDVVDLGEELVAALGQLFTAPQMFQGLLGRFVNFDALIDYLEEERVTGSVVITGGSQMGVILLGEGQVVAAYTESDRAPDTKITAVATLARETAAKIEVRSGGGAVGGIDVEASLSKPL